MKSFEYAHPETETEAVKLLNVSGARTAVLAGGTDLVGLMHNDLIAPDRVVDIRNIDSMQGIREESGGLLVGALTSLDDVLAQSPPWVGKDEMREKGTRLIFTARLARKRAADGRFMRPGSMSKRLALETR